LLGAWTVSAPLPVIVGAGRRLRGLLSNSDSGHEEVGPKSSEMAFEPTSSSEPLFRTVAPPSTDEVEVLVEDIATGVERWLSKAGYGEDASNSHDENEDIQSLIQSASVEGRIGLGKRRGEKNRRVQWLGGKEFRLPPRCATFEGYNLHAGVDIPAWDRQGLEQLCRYVLRPPLAKARLTATEDGGVDFALKRAWSDGTTSLRFTALELTEKLAALVPPPRKNQVFYHGVLGARSK